MAEVTILDSTPPDAPLPAFEGKAVDGCIMRISGATPLEDADVVVSVNDRVRLVGEYRVVSIRHYIDATGGLIREQVLKPQVATLTPWNASDPNDDGVIRAR